jgi:hypothetical protein
VGGEVSPALSMMILGCPLKIQEEFDRQVDYGTQGRGLG